MSRVIITHDPGNIEAAINEALEHVDLAKIVSGRRVAIKPNETYATEDDITGVTQADTLRAVLRAVRAHAPRELIVTGGSGAASTPEVFRLVGLDKVVEEAGAEFVDHNQPPYADVELDYGRDREVQGPQRSVRVHRRVLEYEALIVVSQLKLHETATVTMALKNIAMSFPAAEYYGYPRSTRKHDNAFFDDMHSFIAAMARRFPIDLAITVGHPAMVATGPLGGHAVETGLAIVSTDALAADVVGARLLGFTTQAVRHLWEAKRLGVGEADVDKMEFPAMSLRDAIGTFTEAVYGERLTFEHA